MVTEMSSTPSEDITAEVEKTISMFSRPDLTISDYGPQYQGKAFHNSIQRWGIQQIASSPRYPKSNGFIEIQIQTAKTKHTLKSANTIVRNINTPIDAKPPSPEEMLTGRPIATLLPSRVDPNPEYHQYKEQMEYRQHRQVCVSVC